MESRIRDEIFAAKAAPTENSNIFRYRLALDKKISLVDNKTEKEF
jgi:hypothetical protein